MSTPTKLIKEAPNKIIKPNRTCAYCEITLAAEKNITNSRDKIKKMGELRKKTVESQMQYNKVLASLWTSEPPPEKDANPPVIEPRGGLAKVLEDIDKLKAHGAKHCIECQKRVKNMHKKAEELADYQDILTEADNGMNYQLRVNNYINTEVANLAQEEALKKLKESESP